MFYVLIQIILELEGLKKIGGWVGWSGLMLPLAMFLAIRWIACRLTKSRRHRESYLQHRNPFNIISIRIRACQNLILLQFQAAQFFHPFVKWIQIGVSHEKMATSPYQCNHPNHTPLKPKNIARGTTDPGY